MRWEEAIKYLIEWKEVITIGRRKEVIDMAIEALKAPTESTNTPTNTPTDLISKAKVLETYSELYWFDSDCEVASKAEVDKIYERLQSLPSSEPKTGRWKLVDHLWQCDQCQYRQNEMAPTNFCPSCGAKMEGMADV